MRAQDKMWRVQPTQRELTAPFNAPMASLPDASTDKLRSAPHAYRTCDGMVSGSGVFLLLLSIARGVAGKCEVDS
jgi:hypothetical protein